MGKSFSWKRSSELDSQIAGYPVGETFGNTLRVAY